MRFVQRGLTLLAWSALAACAQAQTVAGEVDEQVVDRLEQLAGGPHAGARATHAKGLLADAVFEPSPEAAAISRAAHFQPGSYSVLARFSDNGGVPTIPDAHPGAQPQGLSLRFQLPGGGVTDLLMLTSFRFPVSNRTDFLAFLTALAASGPGAAHPTAIEQFVGQHPETQRFLADLPPPPRSYSTAQYFAIHAFKFTNAKGESRFGRYRLLPVGGVEKMDPARLAGAAPDYLADALKAQLAAGPVRFRLMLQLAEAGDDVTNCTELWPEGRRQVELGTLTVKSVFADGAQRQKRLAYNPMLLTDGIESSGDPLLQQRSVNYPVSVSRRIASGE